MRAPAAPLGEPISRRTLFKSGGAVIASLGVAALEGCSAGPAAARRRPRAKKGPLTLGDLQRDLAGRLVLPSDPSYPSAKLVFNERFDSVSPAAIAFCRGATDVQRCLEYVRDNHVPCAVRSGGHSYGGYSLSEGLVIDVTEMSGIALTGSRQATIGAGARLIDIYGALGAKGLLLPGGSCPTVGIAGLTLGGGIGVFDRRYGLTCDNLVALELVKADGQLVTCDEATNEDLFWACRGGGGGNFGVVTSFTFRVHPIPDIALFTLDWPSAAATDVLAAWQQWIGGTPDALWSNCQLGASGTGVSVRVAGVFTGTVGSLEGVLAPLLSAVGVRPSYQFVGPDSYLDAVLTEAGCDGLTVNQCHLPSQNPAGTLSRDTFAAKSLYFSEPLAPGTVQAAVDSLAAASSSAPEIGAALLFDAYGGAIAAVAPTATAFAHRDALAGVQIYASWGAGSSAGPGQAQSWLGSAAGAISPGTGGAYVNYIDPTLSDWARAYYGANLARLVRVKAAVDPDRLFDFPQAVPSRLAPG